MSVNLGNVENKNQFYLNIEGKQFFISYESAIVKIENGEITFGKDWDYSKTTKKHLYIYLKYYARLYGFAYRNELYEALESNNKRKALQEMIDKGQIKYDTTL